MPHPAPAHLEPAGIPTRSLQRRLAPQVIGELVIRYTAGEAIRALSRDYSVSRGGLRQLLQGEGVVLREQGIAAEDVDRVTQLYAQGLTMMQVAERVGSSYGTIRKTLHDHGARIRLSGRGRREVPGGSS